VYKAKEREKRIEERGRRFAMKREEAGGKMDEAEPAAVRG